MGVASEVNFEEIANEEMKNEPETSKQDCEEETK